jgi:hypothetical protein
MERYDYKQAVCDDIKTYIQENGIKVTESNQERLFDELNDKLWNEDSVTGNASGSYTFNRWTAEEYLCHNLDLLSEACDEFGADVGLYKDCIECAEKADVTIRCYLLTRCLNDVLDELCEEDEDDEELEVDDNYIDGDR